MTRAKYTENPYERRDEMERKRQGEPATHVWCGHAAELIDLPPDRRDALASMADFAIPVRVLVNRKLLTAEQIPTAAAAAKWSGSDPAMADKRKVITRNSGYLTLALHHGVAPLAEQYALSTVAQAAESGDQWAADAIAHARDMVTVQKHKTRYAGKAVRFTAAQLVRDFKAPVDAVKALPIATTAADAATVRLVERWDAEDWKTARSGDAGAERPRRWAADDLEPAAPLEWLAVGRLPKSAVALLVGDEETGKSLFWTWLVAIVTTGKPCPEWGIPARDPAFVDLIVTEDDWRTVVLPRLKVAGADTKYVRVICVEKDGSGAPTFPHHMAALSLAEADTAPALVVVDAWVDCQSPGLQLRDPQQARQALHPWKEFASTTGATILLLTHTNRQSTANPRDKYGITSELRKKARATIFAQKDPDNVNCSLIGPEKSNLAGQIPADRFRIDVVQFSEPTDSSDGKVARLTYVESAGKSSRELISAAFFGPDDDDDDSDMSEAMNWLEDYLSEHGRIPSKTVKREAHADGITERTIKRAAEKMKRTNRLAYFSEGFPRVTFWELLGGTPVDDDGNVIDAASKRDDRGQR